MLWRRGFPQRKILRSTREPLVKELWFLEQA